MAKIRELVKKFMDYGRAYNAPNGFLNFIEYAFLTWKYAIGMPEYFEQELWNKKVDHSGYISTLSKEKYRWKNVRKKFTPNASLAWLICHRVDYLISRLILPGLNAMDYFRYEMYTLRFCKRKTFITEGELAKMDRYFNGGTSRAISRMTLLDKAQFNKKFGKFIARLWVDAKTATYEDFLKLCQKKQKVIVKPSEGTQGSSIFIADVSTEVAILELWSSIHGRPFVVEEIVVQHASLSALNSSSVNTIRVYTVKKGDQVFITGATLRMGCGSGPTDNYSAGGLAAEVDTDTGIVITRAVTQNAGCFYVHPYSHKVIIGFQIPEWNKIKEVVKEAHLLVPDLGYIGWDVAVCADNQITLIEANTFAGVALQQHPGLSGKKELYRKFY
jgi:hypothetical protein